jgi:hypothetical protein
MPPASSMATATGMRSAMSASEATNIQMPMSKRLTALLF